MLSFEHVNFAIIWCEEDVSTATLPLDLPLIIIQAEKENNVDKEGLPLREREEIWTHAKGEQSIGYCVSCT